MKGTRKVPKVAKPRRAPAAIPVSPDTRAEEPRRRDPVDNQELMRSLGLRPKLTVSQAGDADEHEADEAADAYSRGEAAPAILSRGARADIHRQCLDCEEDTRVSRKASESEGGGAASGASAKTVKRAMRASDGQAIPTSVRHNYERFFGNNLENVRLHTGPAAESAAGMLSAKAFTRGSDIYFNRGRYDPDSSEGRHLLAHELAHTQQGGATLRRAPEDDVCSAEAGMCTIPAPEPAESSLLDPAHVEHDEGYDPCVVNVEALSNYELLAEYRAAMAVISGGRDAPGYFDYRNLQRRLVEERDRRVDLGHRWLATMPEAIPEMLYRLVEAPGRIDVLAVPGGTASGVADNIATTPLITQRQFDNYIAETRTERVSADEYMSMVMPEASALGTMGGLSTVPLGPRGVRDFRLPTVGAGRSGMGPMSPVIGEVATDAIAVLDSWAQPFELGYGSTITRRIRGGTPEPLGHPIAFDIDEPFPVGDRSTSPARAYERATDPFNRQLLDWLTNRRTKGLGISAADIARRRSPLPEVSLADDPAAIVNRRVGEVTEMRIVFEEALARVSHRRDLTPTALKEAINAQIHNIIRNGETPAGRAARDALRAQGYDGRTAVRPSSLSMAGTEAARGGALSGGIAIVGSAAYMLWDDADHPDWALELGISGGVGGASGALGSATESLIFSTGTRAVETSMAETGIATLSTSTLRGASRFGGGAVGAMFVENISMGFMETRDISTGEFVERNVRSAAIGGASVWAGAAAGTATGAAIGTFFGPGIGTAFGAGIGFFVGLGISAALYYAGENLVPGGREDWDAHEAGCTPLPTLERWRSVGSAGIDSDSDFLMWCFEGNTPVAMADGSSRPIREISIGDHIMSYNQSSEVLEPRTVRKVHEMPPATMLHVKCVNGLEVRVTPTHKVATSQGWRPIGDLGVGDTVWSMRGAQLALVAIESTLPIPPAGSVYDLSVDETHTYFAGGLLAHNKLP